MKEPSRRDVPPKRKAGFRIQASTPKQPSMVIGQPVGGATSAGSADPAEEALPADVADVVTPAPEILEAEGPVAVPNEYEPSTAETVAYYHDYTQYQQPLAEEPVAEPGGPDAHPSGASPLLATNRLPPKRSRNRPRNMPIRRR